MVKVSVKDKETGYSPHSRIFQSEAASALCLSETVFPVFHVDM